MVLHLEQTIIAILSLYCAIFALYSPHSPRYTPQTVIAKLSKRPNLSITRDSCVKTVNPSRAVSRIPLTMVSRRSSRRHNAGDLEMALVCTALTTGRWPETRLLLDKGAQTRHVSVPIVSCLDSARLIQRHHSSRSTTFFPLFQGRGAPPPRGPRNRPASPTAGRAAGPTVIRPPPGPIRPAHGRADAYVMNISSSMRPRAM